MVNESSATDNAKFHCSWLLAVAAWGLLLFFLPDFTNVSIGFGAFLALGVSVPLIAVIWIAVTAFLFHRGPRLGRRTAVGWWAANVAFTLAVVLHSTDAGFLVRYWLSESALVEHVDRVKNGAPPTNGPGMVGMFDVEEIQVYETRGVVLFYTCGYDFIDRAGIAYVPDVERMPGRTRILKHLDGPWYTFMWRF